MYREIWIHDKMVIRVYMIATKSFWKCGCVQHESRNIFIATDKIIETYFVYYVTFHFRGTEDIYFL
jgi:hypothetical protein